MTPSEYKTLRREVGTLKRVSDLLGVHWVTIQKREAGAKNWPISREAALAMRSVHKEHRKTQ